MAHDQTVQPIRIFYSYSHRDEWLRDELAKHLSALRYKKQIHDWHDRHIVPGQEWNDEIEQQLNSAQLILLLITSDFLASTYCLKEMQRALTRLADEDAVVIPIVVRPVDWDIDELRKLQALPRDAVPVTDASWGDRDAAWTNVAKGVRLAVGRIQERIREEDRLPQQLRLPRSQPAHLLGLRAELGVLSWLKARYGAEHVQHSARIGSGQIDALVKTETGQQLIVEVKAVQSFRRPLIQKAVGHLLYYRSLLPHPDVYGQVFLVADDRKGSEALLPKLEAMQRPPDIEFLVGYLDKAGELHLVQ